MSLSLVVIGRPRRLSEIATNLVMTGTEHRTQMADRIRALERELSAVPYMGVDPSWNESTSEIETTKYLRWLEHLKREKDADTETWRKIIRWD
jgi:hypothetical protein